MRILTIAEIWAAFAVLFILFIRGAHESAASSIHELH